MSDNGMRLLYNAIALMCCALLAVAFGKWWMIFLVIFFYNGRN